MTEQAASGGVAPDVSSATDVATPDTSPVDAVAEGTAGEGPLTAALKRRVKYKDVDDHGNEVDREEELDIDSIAAGYQNARSSTARYKAAAAKERRLEQQIRDLNAELSDPMRAMEVLRRAGHDPDKLAEARVVELLRREMMSPAERRKLELEQEVQQLEAHRNAIAEQQRQAHLSRATAQAHQRILAEMKPAISAAGLPQTDRAVERVATVMHQAMVDGYDLTAVEAARIVRQEYEAELRGITSAAEGQQLAALLGDETLNKVRRADLARVQKGPPTAQTQRQASADVGRQAPKKRWDDIFGDK